MLIELLRPTGTDLARRWVAALLLVPMEERPALVAEIERRIVEAYAPERAGEPASHAAVAPGSAREFTVVSPPVQRDGYVEQIETTYEVKPEPAAKPARRRKDLA